MQEIAAEFISKEKRRFKWGIGRIIASSLSGFIAGIVVSVIVFLTIFQVSFR